MSRFQLLSWTSFSSEKSPTDEHRYLTGCVTWARHHISLSLSCFIDESWTIKRAEHQTVVLEKTLESPLDYKEIKSVCLKEISPEYSLERPMLKLKLQYFGHLMRKADSLDKTLMLGKT